MTAASVLVVLASGLAVAASVERPVVALLAGSRPLRTAIWWDVHAWIVGRLRALRPADPGAGLASAAAALASEVRGGASVEEGFAVVGRTIPGGVGAACGRLAERLALGEPFGEALDRWVEELGGADAALLAATLRMHRRSGGSLAPLLDDLARTTRERLEMEADLRALTAQGRMSAWIVGSLPVAFLAFLAILTGPSILATFTTPLGAGLFLLGLGLEVGAVVWMRRILEVRP